eukprot:7118053-Pyramimonas_sp.AAC.1
MCGAVGNVVRKFAQGHVEKNTPKNDSPLRPLQLLEISCSPRPAGTRWVARRGRASSVTER